MKKLLGPVALAAALLLGAAPDAVAGDTVCAGGGFEPPITAFTIGGSVRAGVGCDLSGITVLGNVFVTGTLVTDAATMIHGKIEVTSSGSISLLGGKVMGSVQFKKTTSASDNKICGVEIFGDLQIVESVSGSKFEIKGQIKDDGFGGKTCDATLPAFFNVHGSLTFTTPSLAPKALTAGEQKSAVLASALTRFLKAS